MAVKQTKKLSEQSSTVTIESGEKFAKVDANGNVTLIDLPNLKAELLKGLNLSSLLDNVFIMYHGKSNNSPLMVRTDKWSYYQNNGEIADGVVIIEGGKMLVVAPTECTSDGLLWSSGAVNSDAFSTDDRLTAMNDWGGKENTAAILAASTSSGVTNTASYAPGFCNLYSRTNANGHGLTAGKWWLPSLGEAMMISANMNKINYALSLINGATPLAENVYWTSTDQHPTAAWCIYTGDGTLDRWKSKTSKCRVRPVSAFII